MTTQPQLLTYNMAPAVTAFSTTRQGGVSVGAYGGFNINRYCGDDPAHIAINRQALAEALEVDEARIIVPHQVHSTEVKAIDETLLALPADRQAEALDGFDAVMTNLRGVCIGVSTADCIPILLYDPTHHAAAAVHAGWRGTMARIAMRAIEALQAAYDTSPQDLVAVIGPGISLRNFEVGQEVYDAFNEAGHPMERIATRQQKWHINLPTSNRLQLEDAGVAPEHIQSTGICTYDSVDRFFSARRLGINSGRIYTGIVLR